MYIEIPYNNISSKGTQKYKSLLRLKIKEEHN